MNFLHKNRANLLVLLIFSVLTIVFTWPFVQRIASTTYGYAGDNFGFIYYLWWWKKALTSGGQINIFFSPLQEAPFGKIIGPESGAFVFYFISKFLTFFTNEIVGYNLFLLISFPLSGFFTFLLIKEIFLADSDSTKKSWQDPVTLIAFWAGLVYAFCPYHLWKAYNHLDLTQIQFFPLYFYALIRLFKSPSVKTSLLAAVSLALITLTNFYYGFFAILASLVFVPSALVSTFFYQCNFSVTNHQSLVTSRVTRYLLLITSKVTRYSLLVIGFIKKYFIYLLLFAIFSVALVLPFLRQELLISSGKITKPAGLSGEVYDRPMDTLLLLSARPWSYVLPSIDHPVLGEWSAGVYKKISSLGSDFKYQSPFTHEGTIFVGWITLIFSITGIVYWLFSIFAKRFVTRYSSLVTSTWLFPFLFTALWLFLVSMPPFVYIAGKNILLPTYFLHRYFPMFRSYARLGILVLVCLLVPAAYGLLVFLSKVGDYLSRITNRTLRNMLLVTGYSLLVTFSLFEFINFPPAKLVDLSTPPVYQWLASQPGDFNIVEYPKEFNVAEALLFQRIHGKGLFNPHTGSPYESLWSEIGNIQDPNTPKTLAALGIKYTLLHRDCLFTQENPVDNLWYTRCYGEKMPDLRALPEGFQLVGEWDGVAVLEVK